MQGQSSPVQVKDPYIGSILMHVGSTCKHTGVFNVHLPRIIRNWLMGVTRKKNKQKNKKKKTKKKKKKKNIQYQEQEIFVNFLGYHGPLSGQNCMFWGSFLGQNVHFVRQIKPSDS